METLCKEVDEKFRVNLENEEIKDIKKAVDIMVRRFVEALHDINTEIKIDRPEFCGSMAEDTRIWEQESGTDKCDLEFDYLIVIKSWPGCGNFEFFPSYKEGKMKIRYKVTDEQSVTDVYRYVSTAMKISFMNTVLKGTRAKCERNLCTRQLSNIPKMADHGCQYCTVYRNTGNLRITKVPMPYGNFMQESFLSFVWSSIKRSVYKPFRPFIFPERSPDHKAENELQIKVDFNPVIEVNNKMIALKNDGTTMPLQESDIYFLFPYLPRLNNIYWRISTCHSELKHLQETSKEHKLAFCVLKLIGKAFQYHGKIEYVKSYEAKCVVLNHIKKCQTPNRGAHICLLDMIKDIYECARNRDLPHPVLPSCNVYRMQDILSYSDIWEPQLKEKICKYIFSLFDLQDYVSLDDLYSDISSFGKLYEKFRRTKDDNLFVDFLRKKREASANEVENDMRMI
ncbi:uncharacterized protein LOC128551945 [Mercenaria mercenaria]|uniref:uncharacterized protein LOC128551945 n=1 Tax=Mercenaria mercenaria TaxID=6596 RepID=UPI00234F5B0A|nr:uncharacterized protein LOC128551945 [Mercenaria mercenaria]